MGVYTYFCQYCKYRFFVFRYTPRKKPRDFAVFESDSGARDILNSHLSDMDFDAFKNFFNYFEIDDDRGEKFLIPWETCPSTNFLLMLDEGTNGHC